jgi:hypothetical protein
MPVFRSQVNCGSTVSGQDIVAYSSLSVVGPSSLFGNTYLGSNPAHRITMWGTKVEDGPADAAYIFKRRTFHTIPDAYYIMDLTDVYEVYQTGFSTPSTSFELGHGAGWSGHIIWFLNQSTTGVPVIMDGTTTWTVAAHTSTVFHHYGGNSWILLARGMSILGG